MLAKRTVRTRQPEAAHAKVRAFLDACTEPFGAPVLTFQLWAGGPDERTGNGTSARTR
ncbi:hypothetical protein [Amycolatopsis sp. NPDC054798]